MAVWQHWTNSNTTTTTGNYLIWSDWVGTSATGSTTYYSNDNIWYGWQNTPVIVQGGYHRPVQASQEEVERRDQEHRARILRIAAEKKDADLRAEELLKVILTDEQWAAYTEKREFAVIGKSGRRYLIRRGTHGNVKVVQDEVVIESLCIQPPLGEYDEEMHYREVPLGDVMVAQVLGIRHDEENFRRVANITVVNRPREAVRV